MKIASIGVLKYLAILRASMVEGMYLPDSIEMIVCRDTPTACARISCVISFFARSTLIEFCMIKTVLHGIKKELTGFCNKTRQ